ncbi:hypothetical protein BD769DRAFT_1388867 [Suillus cothurnatus]|nr:hypothetical protein BD769DRAFT_1388867 [Suillus cothurnatus]
MNAARICAQLYNDKNSRPSVFAWAAGTLCGELCKEVAELSLKQHGLHFKAASATVEQLETSFMSQLAPYLIAGKTSGHDSIPEEDFAQNEMDLRDLGGDELNVQQHEEDGD